MNHTTPEQDHAADFVSEFFGAAQVDDQSGNLRDGSVRITGLREDVVRSRWIVALDGTVTGAWDPDCALTRYRPGRGDDGPQDARNTPGDVADAARRAGATVDRVGPHIRIRPADGPEPIHGDCR